MALKSVVVPTDFSAGAKSALMRALHLPLHPKAKVCVLHVLPGDIPGKLRDEALTEAKASIATSLAEVMPLMLAVGVKADQVTGDVVEGSASDQIVKRAKALEADVVVMGRHGRRPLMDLLIGTTAQKVVRAGTTPVLLVQLPVAAPYKRPLVAVGLERSALPVVKSASAIAGDSVKYTLFHASEVPFEDFVTLSTPDRAAWRERYESEAQKGFKSLAKKLSTLDFETRVQSGDARSLILEEATRLQADLIAVGTRRRTGVASLLLGSVAEWVMRHATADVLVAHA